MSEERTKVKYCNNQPCEFEATHFYVTERDTRFYLCQNCRDAFELGQVNPEADLVLLAGEPDE